MQLRCPENRLRGRVGRTASEASWVGPRGLFSNRSPAGRGENTPSGFNGLMGGPRGLFSDRGATCRGINSVAAYHVGKKHPILKLSQQNRRSVCGLGKFWVSFLAESEMAIFLVILGCFRCCLSRFGRFICISDGFGHFCGGLEAFSGFFVACWNFSTSFSMTF